MNRSRRDVLGAMAGLAGTSLGAHNVQAEPAVPAAEQGARLQIVMLAHPDMTALDLVAPQLVFAPLGNVEVHRIGRTVW